MNQCVIFSRADRLYRKGEKCMEFHSFGHPSAPVLLLIHGTLTPWQIWKTQIAHFSRSYHVIAAALDAHTEEENSEFRSIEQQAEKIAAHLDSQCIRQVDTVCGISLGGVIAYHFWKASGIPVHHLILDGAPLVRIPRIAEVCMIWNYRRILRASRQRDPRTLAAFKRDFLPEQYLESYLKIADRMSDDSICALLRSVCRYELTADMPSGTRVLFLHGTKGNEMISAKAAKRLRQHLPELEILCCEGRAHCEIAVYRPEKWLEIVENWMHQA